MGYIGFKGWHYMIPGSKYAGCHLSFKQDKTKLDWQIHCRSGSCKVCAGRNGSYQTLLSELGRRITCFASAPRQSPEMTT